jgi:hypothetical protein
VRRGVVFFSSRFLVRMFAEMFLGATLLSPIPLISSAAGEETVLYSCCLELGRAGSLLLSLLPLQTC